ncbi:MAG: PRC-barrel domain-containing protein [Verrucomicrobia bacterium]|nr:PRC-barrel domain-containing protein [Verrucomicrobiota bacterium]
MKMKYLAIALFAGLGITAYAEDRVSGSNDLDLCTLVHGARIRSSDGADVGTVNDLIIDRRSGRIIHVVVSRGEDQLVALPYSAVNVTNLEQRGTIVVNLDRERIVSAPTFSRTELRSLNRETIDRSVNYFGQGGRSTTGTEMQQQKPNATGTELQRQQQRAGTGASAESRRESRDVHAPAASPGSPPAVGETTDRKNRKGAHKKGASPSPSQNLSPGKPSPSPSAAQSPTMTTPLPGASPSMRGTSDSSKERSSSGAQQQTEKPQRASETRSTPGGLPSERNAGRESSTPSGSTKKNPR